eukprot:1072924-Pyramimonas_sp.AAC.1
MAMGCDSGATSRARAELRARAERFGVSAALRSASGKLFDCESTPAVLRALGRAQRGKLQ